MWAAAQCTTEFAVGYVLPFMAQVYLSSDFNFSVHKSFTQVDSQLRAQGAVAVKTVTDSMTSAVPVDAL